MRLVLVPHGAGLWYRAACRVSLPSIVSTVVVGAVLALQSCGPAGASAPSITFAHVTDAHIFDEGWKDAVDEAMRKGADNRAALRWAIDAINREVLRGAAIDFVAYTGDWGLQNVDFPPGPSCNVVGADLEPGLPRVTLDWAVQEVATEFKRLVVPRILLVAGNNDLIDEQVTDSPRHECFVQRVQAKLKSSPHAPEVIGLQAGKTVRINDVHVAGLNTASFKEMRKYKAACSGQAALADPLRGACPKPQMEALRAHTVSPLVLFTHVPDLKDPFRPDPQNPSQKRDSWEVEPDIRRIWEDDICPKVSAIFAGHFHAADRRLYGSPEGTKHLQVSPRCVAAKTWVAPPLAVKYQPPDKPGARGFLLVTMTTKVERVDHVWFEGSGAPAGALDSTLDRLSRWKWPLLILATIAAWFVLVLTGPGKMGWRAYRDAIALILLAFFLELALAAAWVARVELQLAGAAPLLALLIVPLLFYAIVSGRLTRFRRPRRPRERDEGSIGPWPHR